MENQSFLKSFIQNIVSQVTALVNQFALNRLQETGRFDATEAYYILKDCGGTLDEYVSNTFWSQLFSRKASF
jgi:hypothetical protein